MRSKILWIIDSLGPGGAEQITLRLMQKLDRERFDLRVCTLQERLGNPIGTELIQNNIPVDRVNIPKLSRLSNLPDLIKYVRAQQPDVIHTQLQFSDILGNLTGTFLRIPSVSTQHTRYEPKTGTAYWRNELAWFILRNFTNYVIAVSEDTRQFHKTKGGIPEKRIITIHNGIDLSAYVSLGSDSIKEKRALLNIPEEAIVFSTVAVLREQKGIQFMIKALSDILKEVPNLCYLIIGEGEYGETLKEQVLKNKLEKNVFFLGHREDINELLAISDAFVLPTLIEALPTVLMEAMAAKIAIIASAVGGIPEMIENNKNGLLVSPANVSELANACIKLAQNKSLRDNLGAQGSIIAHEKFEIQNVVDKLSDLYEELINNGR